MIVVHLIGGLGNQMFQYATARRLSEIWKVPLKLDVSGYKTDSSNPYPRRYGLGIFKINQDFITQVEINQWIIAKTHRIVRGWFIFITKLKSFKKLQFVWNLIAKLRITQKLVVLFFLTDFLTYRLILEVQEKSINFNPLILFLSKDAYINGFWQSERYFKDIESIIRKEFSFNQKPDIQNKELIDLITSTNSISIHIRRGDYISDPIVRRDFGSLGLSYYKKCIDFISEKVENPHFFIFSDDISWVTKNLKINFPITYVDNNPPEKDYEDLRLMSLCKHNIIANSSFSWWGAWLNSNPTKIVLTPRNYYTKKELNTKYRVPKSWIQVQ